MSWETIPKQTLFGFGDNGGEIGDCFRCCVAAVIGVPAHFVPHFEQTAQRQNLVADAIAQEWLAGRKFWLLRSDVTSVYGAPWCVPAYSGVVTKQLPVICVGPTVRSKDASQTHCVVMDGDMLLYDPHPSEAGLLAIIRRYLIVPTL